jgi:hypothetical protein
VKLVPNRLRKGKRREPRFYVVCQPDYQEDSGVRRLHHIDVMIRNDSDRPHHLDEAMIRYDDGRVGLSLPLSLQLFEDIPARESVTLQLTADNLLAPGAATRFRLVVSRGKGGRRLEWSSKEERFIHHGQPSLPQQASRPPLTLS